MLSVNLKHHRIYSPPGMLSKIPNENSYAHDSFINEHKLLKYNESNNGILV